MRRRALVAILMLGVLAGPVGAVSMGLPVLTPDTQVLPLHGFRLDLGVLQVLQMTSLRSRRSGDLWGPYLALTYGAAPNAELAVDGMLYKQFIPDRGRGSAGVGDFAVWCKILLGESAGHLRYGIRFGAKLPNTPSNKDFGTNQTDFFMHLLAGVPWRGWDFSAFGGIGILERPGGRNPRTTWPCSGCWPNGNWEPCNCAWKPKASPSPAFTATTGPWWPTWNGH